MGNKHPLDVFRSSGEGFDGVSRGRRRTITGKVIASSVKKTTGPRKVPLSTGRPKRQRSWWPFGGRSPSPRARRAEGSSRTLFYGAVTVVALVALLVALRQTFHQSDVATSLPSLKMDEALSRPAEPDPAAPPAPAPSAYTVRAATYNGSEKGREQALAAQAELLRRFFRDVLVIGYPDPGKDGAFASYAVLVGRAPRADDLAADLARLRAIDDWEGGKAAPFVSALVEPYPEGLAP